jgi:hypothetical protein
MSRFVFMTVLAVLALAAGPAEAEKAPKVDICHVTGNGKILLLNVSGNSLDGHLGHGDFLPQEFFEDGDGDGFGDAGFVIEACEIPEGYVDNGSDCDDEDPDVYPGAEEICNDGIDNDCDGEIDEDCDPPEGCVYGAFENSEYYVCRGAKTFGEAQAACDELGASLAYIDSEAENTFVVNLALGAFGCISYSQTSYWIANTKNETPALWPSGNAVFAPGEPSGDGNNIHILRYCGAPYGWNDVPTSYQWGWVCEMGGFVIVPGL